MLFAIIGAGIILFIAFSAFKDFVKHRLHHRGWAVLFVRWLTGSHWTGEPLTNATWRKKGHGKALTKTGQCRTFYYRPRLHRTGIRVSETFGPFLAFYGYWKAPGLTLGVLIAGLCSAAVYAALASVNAVRERKHRRDWTEPLHARVAPMADIPVSASPGSWIEVSKDRSKAKLTLPPGFRDTEASREQLAKRAAEALGMESPEITWSLYGKAPTLELESAPAPPKYVALPDVIDAIKASELNQFILGIGRRSIPVDISLHDDSPHLGASMGAGAGKSTLARFFAAQALFKGCIVVFIDLKRISHTWARGLPNVIYADTPELAHEAFLWLGKEMDRRNEVSVFTSDDEGEVSADVGPRVVVIAEELNLAANRLRSHWIETLGGKGVSPALTALQDVAFAGRQVRMNIFMIGQMLTARVAGGNNGGGEARENVGVRMLARYTKRNWQMLVPEHPMPLVSDILGRIQVIASGKVRECQVAYITGAEAKRMATAGEVAKLPSNVPESLESSYPKPKPGLSQVAVSDGADSVISPLELESGPGKVTESTSYCPRLNLAEIIDQGILPGKTLGALRKDRLRDPSFPEPVGVESNAHVYDLGDIEEWWRNRKGKKR